MNKRNKGGFGSKTTATGALIPIVTAEGIPAFAKASDLKQKGKWTHYHGTAVDGTQVNSLQAMEIGRTTVIQHTEGGPMFSVLTNELEVMATKFVKAKSIQV